MTPAMRHVLGFFLNYGVFGLLLLTIADDSFLFLPVGGDLLMVILVARNHSNFRVLRSRHSSDSDPNAM